MALEDSGVPSAIDATHTSAISEDNDSWVNLCHSLGLLCDFKLYICSWLISMSLTLDDGAQHTTVWTV